MQATYVKEPVSARHLGGYVLDAITTGCPSCIPGPSATLSTMIFAPQEQPQWCWAAVAEMLMNTAHPRELHRQCDIIEMQRFGTETDRVCADAGPQGFREDVPTRWDIASNIDGALAKFRFQITRETTPWSFAVPGLQAFSKDLIKEEIACNSRPIAFEWAGRAGAHDMIIYGYRTTSAFTLLIYNPGIPESNVLGESSSVRPHDPELPAMNCMFSTTCALSFADFIHPNPFTLRFVYFRTEKSQ